MVVSSRSIKCTVTVIVDFLGIHHHAPPPQGWLSPAIAIEAVLEANALDKVAQLALGRLITASGKVPVIRRARQACEPAQALHIGVRTGCFQCHGFDDFDDADAGLPCAAGRSNARKAFRKKTMSSCWRPTSRSSSANARVRLDERRALLVIRL
jgi:hypothetical protein